MMEFKDKAITLGVFLFLAIFSMYIEGASITGLVVQEDNCEYYHDLWSNESWFNEWDWWNQNCAQYYSSGPVCGNDILEYGEECDTNDNVQCIILGFQSGYMTCDDCKFNTTQCSYQNEEVDYSGLISWSEDLQECNTNLSTAEINYQECLDELGYVVNEYNCSETDSGNDYYTSGTSFTGSDVSYTDSCNGNTLLEYFCNNTRLTEQDIQTGGLQSDYTYITIESEELYTGKLFARDITVSKISASSVTFEIDSVSLKINEGEAKEVYNIIIFVTDIDSGSDSVTYSVIEKNLRRESVTCGDSCSIGACVNTTPETTVYNVTACQNISSSGYYYLMQDINTDEGCFTIYTSNVVLDGNGYELDGDDDQDEYGIFAFYAENITIKNFGDIKNFYGGISLAGVNDSFIENNVMTGNDYGMWIAYSSENVIKNI